MGSHPERFGGSPSGARASREIGRPPISGFVQPALWEFDHRLNSQGNPLGGVHPENSAVRTRSFLPAPCRDEAFACPLEGTVEA